ncbi:MAG: cysteine hydrolase [Firmicutes bacterium]|jgi:nicotinamidase/pyrazinamidase|nr:cysteine hydrolase [Bacillota bacterium]
MNPKVLLVVDMLNDFIDPGGSLYCGPSADSIVPFVRDRIREVLESGGFVVFICDSHDPDDIEFRRFPPHCVRGTNGAEIIPALRAASEGSDRVFEVKKKRYSGFYGTDLGGILERIGAREVEVVGVCTNICVLYTVEGLCNRDYSVRVLRGGVASFDDDAAKWALKQMETVLGAAVV